MGLWNFLSGSTPAGVISETGQKVVAGIFDGVDKLIDNFHLSPGDAQQFKLSLAQMQLDAAKMQVEDAQSARAMQMQTRSLWPGILTLTVTIGFFAVMTGIIMYGLPHTSEAGQQAILILMGSLVSGFGMVLTFWFGSTMGSQNKDQMIWRSTPTDTK